MTEAEIAKRLDRVRRMCLAFPDVSEKLSHGAPTFFIRGKATFVMFLANHHGDGRIAIWCAAPDGAQEVLVAAEPERFFRPPYVGPRGWIGIRLERPDWKLLEGLIEDAYQRVSQRRKPR